jgi:hypothetical protein
MAYNTAPEAELDSAGFSGAVGGPAETKGIHTAQIIGATTTRPIPVRSRGFNKPDQLTIFIGLLLDLLGFGSGVDDDCSGKFALHPN